MMKFFSCKLLTLLIFSSQAIPSQAKSPQEAKDAFGKMKITYSKNEFFFWARIGKTDAVKLFLEAGMNPDARDKDGQTALSLATAKNHPDIVKFLKDAGVEDGRV